MSKNFRRSAFTLIEVLIVIIIMAVLAATIIPQFSSSTTDAKTASVQFNLHTIRSQLELYKTQHLGTVPALTKFVDQMTKKSDASGATTGDPTTLIFGPYIQTQVPANPFNGSNALVAVATPGSIPTGVVAGGGGWQYDESNGGFYPNNKEYYPSGT